MVGIIVVGLFFRIFGVKENTKVEHIENSLQQLRASLDAQSERQFHIQKIMRIIQQYNTEMSSEMRYEIADAIHTISIRYANLNVDLICAIITKETVGTWDPELVSQNGAMGLMQILPEIGFFVAYYENISWQTPEEVLLDPIYNIRIGSRYLSTMIENYDVDGGIAAYNSGAKMAAAWVRSGRDSRKISSQARQYLTEVMELYNKFQTVQ